MADDPLVDAETLSRIRGAAKMEASPALLGRAARNQDYLDPGALLRYQEYADHLRSKVPPAPGFYARPVRPPDLAAGPGGRLERGIEDLFARQGAGRGVPTMQPSYAPSPLETELRDYRVPSAQFQQAAPAPDPGRAAQVEQLMRELEEQQALEARLRALGR